MRFELLPTIALMTDLYTKPRNLERFHEYLNLLQGGTTGDLVIPISGFNPMGKAHLLDKLDQLKTLDAEGIVEKVLLELNRAHLLESIDKTVKVAINVADDAQGGWTNRFTSDYDSKFKFSGVFNRNFCTPYFWTSESYTADIIRQRILEYVFRTVYWQTNPKPKTLKAHLAQEVYVAKHATTKNSHPNNRVNNRANAQMDELSAFYQQHENTDDYHLIFHFFYGDDASCSLGFPTFGLHGKLTGFDYAQYLAYAGKK